MIKTLKQAGLDNRGEVHAPPASECDTRSGRVAKGDGGSDTVSKRLTTALKKKEACERRLVADEKKRKELHAKQELLDKEMRELEGLSRVGIL